MIDLTEQMQDIAMAQGFLEEWTANAPLAVKDNLKCLIDGIDMYRKKYAEADEDYQDTLERYTQLSVLGAGYLQLINQQKEQIDQLLIETQKDSHHQE